MKKGELKNVQNQIISANTLNVKKKEKKKKKILFIFFFNP